MTNAFADDLRSSSVMDEMAALFAPPGREARNQQKSRVELHPYFKRPGKGHNHDVCDACGEGGDLICCDNCPASFHFSCHAPPLEEEDIPLGDWICLRCYHREQLRLATINSSLDINLVGLKRARETGSGGGKTDSSVETDSNSAVANETSCTSAIVSASGSSRNRKAGKSVRSKKHHHQQQQQQQQATEQAVKEKMVKIYRSKYEKYLRVKPETNSPFDTLVAASQVLNAEQFKLPTEMELHESLPFSWKWADERQDDFDSYPRNCTNCRKTSKGMPSIGCDFCPSVYHLDCLDPPLCEIPKERWMCPNHVENFIDSRLVSSTSLNERMRLWKKHAQGPIDHDAVRLQFFRKVRTGKLYQKANVPRLEKPPDLRIKVPGYVKNHYKNPIEVFPAEQQTNRPVATNRVKDEEGNSDDKSVMQLDEEQNEWLKQLVALQTGILRQQMKTETENRKAAERLQRLERQREKEKQRKLKKLNRLKGTTNPPPSSEVEETLQNGRLLPDDDFYADDSFSSCSTVSELSLGLDESDEVSADAQAEICDFIVRNKPFVPDIDSLDPTIRDFLAMQRMRELFISKSAGDGGNAVSATSASRNSVQARCALVPIDNPDSKDPCLIQRRSLDIGLGSGVQLDLSRVGHCNYVSAKHASIFYDQYSRVYELINYSEHGSIVDNVVYTVENVPKIPEGKSRARSSKLYRMSSQLTTSMKDFQVRRPCRCTVSLGSLAADANYGCETSAVLHHGSYVRFGCLQFAFTIVDYQVEVGANGRESESKSKEDAAAAAAQPSDSDPSVHVVQEETKSPMETD